MEVMLTSDFRDFLCLIYKYSPPPQLVSYWICAAFSGVPDRQSRWNGVPEKTSEISDQSNTTAATEDHGAKISSYQPWNSSYGSGKGDILRGFLTAALNRPVVVRFALQFKEKEGLLEVYSLSPVEWKLNNSLAPP